jgi:Rrf2 family transcriptional regulator, cysteine metabolism repressor
MRVSTKATYGILAALDLAANNGTAPVQAKAIARRQTIPVRFLEQVLHAMKQAGLVDSMRGAQGGYLLNRLPTEISLAEIIEALDGSLAPSPARSTAGRRQRQRKPDALLAGVWEQVRAAELKVLEALSLKDLVERQQQLEQQRALMYHI